MPPNTGKQAFLAALAFLIFIIPLLLADEVSLLTTWLFIFISWSFIILLSALSPSKDDNNTAKQTD
ncbi:hypothetical protein CMT41_17905 [Colwellia sp. MT41]|uniref:hypothetical protein n=1 Tax=Colwellia sp. MT41 TaxID=58049 RepID=UPI0007179B2F|nr:hypothetical protein [Colwellia sp. MT41]ALO36407.1 hypothetical protein CMT41_17905 [Colwellia sp. MT41]